jgi:S-DNA-T family DNA segregation ATPase FtsK/SpoIIIE
MAKNNSQKRANDAVKAHGDIYKELSSFGLLFVAAFLVVSLLSYNKADLPVFYLFREHAPAPTPLKDRENYIGPVGAFLGAIQLILFGAAAYLIPTAFLWWGIAKLFFKAKLWGRLIWGYGILIISVAGLFHSCGFFSTWKGDYMICGGGGSIGMGISSAMSGVLGKVGTIMVLAATYLISLILITGLAPVSFIRTCVGIVHKKWTEAKIKQREEEAASENEKRKLAERELERAKRKREREAAKSPFDDDFAEQGIRKPLFQPAPDDSQTFLPLISTPPPKIFDSSSLRVAAPLPGEKPFERVKNPDLSLKTTGFESYELPGFDLLDKIEPIENAAPREDELLAIQNVIIETLKSFGIEVTAGNITRGPTITRYEIYPSHGLRVARISQLEADLARATCAERINILAPIPGRDTVGIEIANTVKVAVPLHELLADPEFRSPKKKIPLALGKDVYGKTVIGDLTAMPHLLVAGATGSGKSVCINSIITSILFKFAPDELRFIMVDPKVVEMQIYNRLPHLVVPVVTDPKKTVAALKWVVNEMEKRYRIFAKVGVRNFDTYNSRPLPEKPKPTEILAEDQEPEPEPDMEEIESIAAALESGELGPEEDADEIIPDDDKIPDRFPYIVVLIDELADLMQTAPADVEGCIARIAQKARAAGIHLIIATQTPRADVVTGIIKANIPCRIAFQVSSQLDSRVILDTKGAEKLVGKGDMLYLPPGSAKLERSQAAYVSDAEVERLVEHCSSFGKPNFESAISKAIESGNVGDTDDEADDSDVDEGMVIKCIEVVRQEQKASTSLLQRRLRLGYTRAARMIDILELRGLIGPGDGAKPREVFLKD